MNRQYYTDKHARMSVVWGVYGMIYSKGGRADTRQEREREETNGSKY